MHAWYIELNRLGRDHAPKIHALIKTIGVEFLINIKAPLHHSGSVNRPNYKREAGPVEVQIQF